MVYYWSFNVFFLFQQTFLCTAEVFFCCISVWYVLGRKGNDFCGVVFASVCQLVHMYVVMRKGGFAQCGWMLLSRFLETSLL
jgi:hypothetical protein